MAEKFNQFKYQQQYNKEHYDRIEIVVPKGQRAIIRENAKAKGMSVSAYIGEAVKEKLERENSNLGKK